MPRFEEAFQSACDSGILPGVALVAADASGKFRYTKTMGVRSTKPENADKPLELDTLLAIASCTKIVTAIAALQCVERGFVTLDEDVARLLPELSDKDIISAGDGEDAKPMLRKSKRPMTLRHMLSHSSGLAYDQLSPLLLDWRLGRGEQPWSAPTIEERCNAPLLFEPGTGWAYSCGADWTGKLIERATGDSLESFMAHNIWKPLGVNDITFWPGERHDLRHRIADLSAWATIDGVVKSVPFTGWDINNGSADCLGGGGLWATAQDFLKILQAVLREDERLLRKESYSYLFEPQLSAESEEALQELLASNPLWWEELGASIPLDGRKSWSLGGIVSLDRYPGWMGEKTLHWQGMPNLAWFVDREVGLCGFVAPQVVAFPERSTPIKDLAEAFKREIYTVYEDSKR